MLTVTILLDSVEKVQRFGIRRAEPGNTLRLVH